jgi:hypothetical protein
MFGFDFHISPGLMISNGKLELLKLALIADGCNLQEGLS